GPALIMAETRAYLRALALTYNEVGDILERANPFLAHDTEGLRFVTLFFGRLEPKSRSFVYANAGHLSGYLFDANGEVRNTLNSLSLPLGIQPEGAFPPGPPV